MHGNGRISAFLNDIVGDEELISYELCIDL